MQNSRIEVLRENPRDRGSFEGLTGSLDASIISDSYMHVGSGLMALNIKEEYAKRVLNKHKSITKEAINELKIETDYSPFNVTGGIATIPGASIKGNVRSRIELSFKAKNGKVRTCFIRSSEIKYPPRKGYHGWRHWKLWHDTASENRGKFCDNTKVPKVCLACNLFGTADLLGLVNFSDFTGVKVNLEPIRPGFGMKLLAAPPKSIFRGPIGFSNLRIEELGLLFLGMGLRNSLTGAPVLFGRLKYRERVGTYKFGRVRYAVDSLKLSRFSNTFNVSDAKLEPGQNVKGESLNNLVKTLTNYALKIYDGELELKNEVETIEQLQ